MISFRPFAVIVLTMSGLYNAYSQQYGTIVMDDIVRKHGRKEINLPDIPGYQTLKCDFHIHTVFSDGTVWPTVRVEEAWEAGLDAISITDHIEGHPKKLPGQKHMAYEIALPAAQAAGLILIKAGEISRGMPPGHFNALFVNDIEAINLPGDMDAIRAAAAQGAFIIWNHPGWRAQQPDTTLWMAEHEELYRQKLIHGIEVFNEKEWYPEAIRWALEKNLTITGNSDIHSFYEYYYDTEKYPLRPVTLVFAKERTGEAIREALFAGRTAALFFNRLVGKEEYIGPLVQGSLLVSAPHFSSGGYSYFTITNKSDIEFTMIRALNDGSELPSRIIVPAGSSVIVKIKKKPEETREVVYRLSNVLTGVEQYYQFRFKVK